MTNRKEKPILYSTPMVKAILDGNKTMTRRVSGLKDININPNEWIIDEDYMDSHPEFEELKWIALWNDKTKTLSIVKPRYQIGDRLWVRETWYSTPNKKELLGYVADGDFPHGQTYCIRPSIFMFRKFSRITLEVTGIGVERVQDITEADAIREGFKCEFEPSAEMGEWIPAREIFEITWNELNFKRGYGWEKNPWVWVYEFRRLEND